jgi:predicted enzyme related to lactoylglutathione lyase
MEGLTVTQQRPASSVTFLYFEDLHAAKEFFSSVLGLEQVLDQRWAAIYRTGQTGFLGACDARKASVSVASRGGVLISLNVDDVETWHARIARPGTSNQEGVSNLTAIKENAEIGLKSFFFRGPEGYDFEIQEFTRPHDRKLFMPEC